MPEGTAEGMVEIRTGVMEKMAGSMDTVKMACKSVEEQTKALESFLDNEMKSISSAKEEYMKLMGVEKPSFAELQTFMTYKKKVLADGRQELGIPQPGAEMKIVLPSMTCYPYDEWGQRRACCIFPLCAACPGYFKCPIECPMCFPCTICCPILKKPPCGLPKMNPCCKITYLCKPVEHACAKPCLVIHPCKCPCPKCCCPITCCGFKTIGCNLICCHCTFGCCPKFCPTPCCAKEAFTTQLHITRSVGVAGAYSPPNAEMKR